MTLITAAIPLQTLKQMAAAGFGNMVKAVVDDPCIRDTIEDIVCYAIRP